MCRERLLQHLGAQDTVAGGKFDEFYASREHVVVGGPTGGGDEHHVAGFEHGECAVERTFAAGTDADIGCGCGNPSVTREAFRRGGAKARQAGGFRIGVESRRIADGFEFFVASVFRLFRIAQ